MTFPVAPAGSTTMPWVNQLLHMLPTKAVREVLLMTLGGIVTAGTSNEAVEDAIRAQLAAVDALGFHVYRDTTQFTCTILTPGALLRFSVFPDGSRMIWAVPTRRIRQVVENRTVTGNLYELLIEFDAGVQLSSLSGTVGGDSAAQLANKPNGWLLEPERTPDRNIPTAELERLNILSAQLRHLLATQRI